jgi:hypothetical protein
MAVVPPNFRRNILVFPALIFLLTLTLLAYPLRAPAQTMTKPVKAQVNVQSSFNDSKMTVDDIDGDGAQEILAGNANGYMYCFTANGGVKWAHYCGAAIRGGAASYDVDGDGKKEVFWGDMNGVVWGVGCNGWDLSQWGWPKQTAVTDGFIGVYGAPAIGDINGDGAVDVVVGTWGHYVYAWSYFGAMLPGWPYDQKDTIWSSPALADLDRDGLKEVVIGGDCTGGSGWPYPAGGLLWVFNGDGSVQPGFPVSTPEVIWSSPACADINNDGYYEIVVGTGHYYTATNQISTEAFVVYAFTHYGALCNSWRVSGCTMSSPAIGDMDGDGVKEIAIGCYPVSGRGADHLILIKGNGGVMWDQPAFGGPNRGCPVMGDINSDGKPEVIMGSGQAIGAWNVWGNCVWNQVLDNFVITGPAVGDFDRDGRVETAVGTGADSGGGCFWVFDCGRKASVSGGDGVLFPWPQFHRTSDKDGAIPTPFDPPPPPPPANFHEYILMMNPSGVKADVTIEFMSEKGEKTSVKQTIEPRSRSTLWVNSVVSGEGISAKVTCSNTSIIVERPMYFNYKGAWNGGHDVMGATEQHLEWYFAEGTCRPNFDAYLCIQNPNTSDSTLKITYMKGDGTTQVQGLTVARNSRSTVRVKDALGEGDSLAFDFSCKVETTNKVPVIVERPMYFNYGGAWTGGHDVMGAQAPAPVFYFAEGTCRPNFEPYLCIQNPGSLDSDVMITYMKGDGTSKVQKLTVSKRSRSTVKVKSVLGEGDDRSHDFSCKVETTNGQDIIAERPMYFAYGGVWTGGHDVMGALAPAPAFYFAEGTCRPNFEPYLCIQNPGAASAAIKITYMKGNGANQVQTLTVGGHSRYTVKVKDVLGEGNSASADFSCKVECTNGQSIIAERPIYFDYKGWNGGHNAVGVSSPEATWYFAEGYTGL